MKKFWEMRFTWRYSLNPIWDKIKPQATWICQFLFWLFLGSIILDFSLECEVEINNKLLTVTYDLRIFLRIHRIYHALQNLHVYLISVGRGDRIGPTPRLNWIYNQNCSINKHHLDFMSNSIKIVSYAQSSYSIGARSRYFGIEIQNFCNFLDG